MCIKLVPFILMLSLSVIFIPKCAIYQFDVLSLSGIKHFIWLTYMPLMLEEVSLGMNSYRDKKLSVIISKSQQRYLIGSYENIAD